MAALVAGLGLGYVLGRNHEAQTAELTTAISAGPVVATFDGGQLTAGELRARIEEEGPLMREQYTTPDGQLTLAKQMVFERLLALDARRKGYDRDPSVARQCEGAIREVYLEREFEQPERSQSISDQELRAYFEKHRGQYERPERVRLARILLTTRADNPAARARQQAAASTVLAELKTTLPKDRDAFASMARRRSEDVRTRALGGELPPLTEPELREQAGEEVATAVFATPRPTGLLPRVFESPDGFQLIQVLDFESARTPSFEQLRETLRTRYAGERREGRQAAFRDELFRRANVQLQERALPALPPAPTGKR